MSAAALADDGRIVDLLQAFAQLANRAISIFVFEERGAAPMPGTPARDQSSSESLT